MPQLGTPANEKLLLTMLLETWRKDGQEVLGGEVGLVTEEGSKVLAVGRRVGPSVITSSVTLGSIEPVGEGLEGGARVTPKVSRTL